MQEASDLTKLTRWVIPGWLSYLAFYVFVSVDIVFSPPGQGRIFPSIVDFIKSMTDINTLLAFVLVAAAGVPLGFIIYQIYFYLRWNSPFSRDGFFPPILTGRMNELKRITRNIEFLSQDEESKWRADWINHSLFLRDHKFRWRYIELLFNEATQRLDEGKEGEGIYQRHKYLHEVTHTLGASIVALYVGFLGYVFLKFYFGLTDISRNIIVILILVIILFFLLNREEKAREKLEDQQILIDSFDDEPISAYNFNIRVFGRNKWKVGISIVSPGALYLFALASIHWMLNPIFKGENNLLDISLRSIMLFVAIILWIMSINKSYPKTRNGYYLVLGISFLFSILLRILPLQISIWIDWALFSNILLFLFMNLILLNNRRNVSDDMSAMEYYTLRLYLSQEHKKHS